MNEEKFFDDLRKSSAGYLFLHAGETSDINQRGGKGCHNGYIREWYNTKDEDMGSGLIESSMWNSGFPFYSLSQHGNFLDLLEQFGVRNRGKHSVDGCVGMVSNVPLRIVYNRRVGTEPIYKKRFGGLLRKKVGDRELFKKCNSRATFRNLTEISSRPDDSLYGFAFATNDVHSDFGGRSGEGLAGAIVSDGENMEKLCGYIETYPAKFKKLLREIFPNPDRPDYFIRKPFDVEDVHFFRHDSRKDDIKKTV